MIYPAAFLATLDPEEVAILTRARTLGVIPWRVMPGIGGALELQGLPLNDGGATGFTVSTELPDGTTRGPTGYLRNRKLSGVAPENTAGWFGIGTPAPSRHACAAAGWVAHWICGGAISVVGRAGHFWGEAFAADSSFRPERAVGASGWVKVQDGNPPVWRWYNGTPGVTEVCSVVAAPPADGRVYARAIGVPAQDPTGSVIGRAIMVDLSDRSAPLVVDRRTFTVPTPLQPKGPEWNHSPEDAGAGTPLELLLELAEGAFGVRVLG